MQLFRRAKAPPTPPPLPAPPTQAAFMGTLRGVRADRRCQPRDYASLAEAIVGSLRDGINSGWLLACWVDDQIDAYLRAAGIDLETVSKNELRLAIRSRADIKYVAKQRIKTDARFDELRATICAYYRTDRDKVARILMDKVAVYYVAGAGPEADRGEVRMRPDPIRAAWATPGAAAGASPGNQLGQGRAAPKTAILPAADLLGGQHAPPRRRAA